MYVSLFQQIMRSALLMQVLEHKLFRIMKKRHSIEFQLIDKQDPVLSRALQKKKKQLWSYFNEGVKGTLNPRFLFRSLTDMDSLPVFFFNLEWSKFNQWPVSAFLTGE